MKCDKLFKIIDDLEEEYINFLIDICNIESPTDNKEGVDRVGNYIISKAEEFGWLVEKQKQEVSGDCICITMNPSSKDKAICFSGHMDTVHPIGLFGYPPVRRDEDKLYGPGVTDCKGGIVASFMAMRALMEVGFTKRPVKLIMQSDEEVSSRFSNKTTIDFMAEKATDCLGFLNCEHYVEGKTTLERKGISKYEITVTGKSEHASKCYLGVSAILEASHKIIEIEKYKNPDGITFNCGKIIGGSADNTVPEKCVFTVDNRFKTLQEMEQADKILQEIAKRTTVEGTSCSLKLISQRPPMEINEKNYDLLKRVNEIYKENGLMQLEAGLNNGGSDASDLTARGIPCLDSLGVVGSCAHSKNEFMYISSLADAAKRLSVVAYCI